MAPVTDIDGKWEPASVREVLFSDWRVASVVLASAAFVAVPTAGDAWKVVDHLASSGPFLF